MSEVVEKNTEFVSKPSTLDSFFENHGCNISTTNISIVFF